MNFGLEGVSRLSPVPGYSAPYGTPYCASFSKGFSIVSSPPPSPARRMEGITANGGLGRLARATNRRMSEGDSQAVIQYEDCTGAVYRIRKGVDKTPLQVRAREKHT